MNQLEASLKLLEESQQMDFPYELHEMGLDLVVFKEVFSPKHFNGWRIFNKVFPDVAGQDVLEVGCGHGATSVYLAKFKQTNRVVAVDINPAAVENTRVNAKRNGVVLDVRESDVYSALADGEKFDVVYWNTPFMYMPESYRYRNVLERGLFDPGYRLAEKFLAEGKKHLKERGKILFGTGSFGDVHRFLNLARVHGYEARLIAKEDSTEIIPIDFQLWELESSKK